MAEHDIKADKVQVNSLESKDTIRISAKNIIGYDGGKTLEDFDLIYKYAVEQMIAAAPGLGNRFRTIILVDDDDNEISRITTTGNLTQFIHVSGELLLQLAPSGTTVVTPNDPEDPDLPPEPIRLNIAWTLSENDPDFLDLNLVFRDAVNGELSNHYNAGSGLVGDGGTKPISGQLMRAEVTYDGGEIGPGDVLVPVWDGPVKVTLEIKKNGIWFDGFVKEYPTPPAVGSLGHRFFTPTEFDTWTVSAKAEPYTVPDEISEVDQPPVLISKISLVDANDTIVAGEASFIIDLTDSYDPEGEAITYEIISTSDGIIDITAP